MRPVALVILIFFWLVCNSGSAQLKAVDEVVSNQDSSLLIQDKFLRLFSFPNVNRIPHYKDQLSLKKITRYTRSQDVDKLYEELFPYVTKFGIENFYKDNQLLWRLAQLEAERGDTLTAHKLYKLVLKHYREGLNLALVKEQFEKLPVETKDDFVPLEYYYELVEYRKEIDTLRPPQATYLNMGDVVNSPSGDYGPALSATGDQLVFTSKRNKIKMGLKERENEDLMISRNESGYWMQAEPLTQINTPFNEGSATISPDGSYLVFARCGSPEGIGSCDLYISQKVGGQWSKADNLGKEVNSIYWDSHPSFSHSGDTIFFASDRTGGFGLSDIYFTHKDGKRGWTVPKNMGPVINTRGSEVSPFYHLEHDVLYFSSNGHLLNFGEFDIYKSYRMQHIWDEPKNIGPLVNGQGSEFYFTIDYESKDLYYARSEEDEMTNLDLYSFPLPMGAQPLAKTSLRGRLVDQDTGEPFSTGIVSIIDLDNGIEVAPKFLRPDGTFEFQLINNNNYLIVIQGDEFFRLEEIFFLEGDTEINRKTTSISQRLKFESMRFDNGDATLKTSMFADLDKIIDFLLDNPDFHLKIDGHTDADGDQARNLKLSEDRANAIKDYIVEFGQLDPDRIEATGYGSQRPIVEEKTEADKQINRRVEFNIVKE